MNSDASALPVSPSPGHAEIVAAHPAHCADVVAIGVGRYAIPVEDTVKGGRWDKLQQKERNRINALLECFRLMEAGKNLREEAGALAFRFRHVKGFSTGTLINSYYLWKKDGWAALRHGYAANKSKLPADFLQYWRALCEQNARSIVEAKKALIASWFSGKSIPGYGTWVDWWHRENPTEDAPSLCPGVPDGWSKTTLYEAGPTMIERLWKTRGLAAVKPLLPSLIRDTSTLLPLQLLTMDDFECDQVCVAQNPRTKQWQTVKVTGVAVMDVATRRVIALLMKPRFTDEEGKRESITRAEVRLLFYQVLLDYGIPAHGMTWLVENAAAAITSELEMTVRNLFGGRVQVTRTGLLHDKVTANGFIERGGKPQEKGWIEARFNLVHNAAGALPGQKGANYLVKPGDHEDKVKYAEHYLGQGNGDAQLSDEQIKRLRLPFKHADELIAFYMSELFPALDRRIEHKMGGFELLRRWRRNAHDTWHEWEELAALTQEEQLAVEWFPRELRESSRMRWDRLIKNVTCEKIAPHVLMMLLLTPRSAKMRKTGVTFTHNGRGYSFADKRALALRLPEGMEVLCYFDPAHPQSVYVCDIHGRFLVELRSLGVNIADPAAMSEAESHLSQIYHTILSEIRARPLHQAADQQLLEDRKHNAAIENENTHPASLRDGATQGTALPATADQPNASRSAGTSDDRIHQTSASTAPAPLSPVRKHLEKRGLTAALARDCFATKPGETLHTPAAEALAQTIIAADARDERCKADARAVQARGDQLTQADAEDFLTGPAPVNPEPAEGLASPKDETLGDYL